MTDIIESQVRDFYNKNYKRFDTSRFSVWNAVKDFVEEIPKNSYVLDAGCGNGKNMIYMNNKNIKTVGIDFSIKLLDICKDKSLNVQDSDIRNLSYNDNTFDYVISIAVIHHLSNENDRITALNEMLRVCKPGGKILVSVWALEQDSNSRFKFKLGDNFVKWEDNDTSRFYHIYNETTIIKLLEGFNYDNLFNENGNWFFILLS
jgi:ubiquinone/menaquinone biosynthesis C-methylase UbiE